MITFLDWVGYIITVITLLTLIGVLYAFLRGIFPALWRLGNGLSKRKIAIFAQGDHLRSLESLLLETKLFNKKNITGISSTSDFDKAEQMTLFLVFWPDWKDDPNQITEILRIKKANTALVVYAPQDKGKIPDNTMKELDEKRNVMLSNFRGRLLNDIVVSLMTTGYQ